MCLHDIVEPSFTKYSAITFNFYIDFNIQENRHIHIKQAHVEHELNYSKRTYNVINIIHEKFEYDKPSMETITMLF